ncbi:mitochondrial distribution and morphology protein [Sporobolomyces salmoneus]|uniref:mitochondrial distribution and morphology protein n=1 Tax=Sporobolomyces salmoneus TaxID=183962 RepID=UPI003172690B
MVLTLGTSCTSSLIRSTVRPRPLPLYAEIHRYFSTLQRPTTATTTVLSKTKPFNVVSSSNGSVPRLEGGGFPRSRYYSSSSTSSPSSPTTTPPDPSKPTSSHSLTKPIPHPISKPYPHYLASLPRSLRSLAASLPSVTQSGRPPTVDQLLSLSTSFFDRLKIRFKWTTIRSYRRFRLDDWSAFFSIGILSTLFWVLLKTTSAFAVVFVLVNGLTRQEWLAKKLGDYLTESTGMKVVFESAIVPKWGLFKSAATGTGGGGGEESTRIVFKNVYISRGPVKGELGVLPTEEEVKEDQELVAMREEEEGKDEGKQLEEELRLREMVAGWTHFHLSIDTVEVTLSLRRWLDGKGLVKNAVVRGVRGVIERSHIEYDPDAPTDRFAYRNKPKPGDFHLESLQIQDFLVTIYQPENFRPYTFSIFNADIRKFRKQWLFYDLMSAESITGQVDNCLFSLHRPQSIGRTSEEDLKDARWSRMSRFRIDGVPIDHMQSSSDTGVMSWVTSGRLDLVADIRFPREDTDLDLSTLVADLVDDLTDRLRDNKHGEERIPGRTSLTRDALKVPSSSDSSGSGKKPTDGQHSREGFKEKEKEERKKAMRFAKAIRTSEPGDDEGIMKKLAEGWDGEEEEGEEEEDKIVSIDLDLRFKDLKAHVPYFTSNLSYVNNALIRPIVAFINSNRTLIPIHCQIDLGLSEFNGSWTTYDVGILERMSEQVYAALAHHVSSQNDQRIQTVGLWTLQMTANAVLNAFQKNLAPY